MTFFQNFSLGRSAVPVVTRSIGELKVKLPRLDPNPARGVALVGIHHSIFSISDCLSSVVANDYLPCNLLSADDSITSKKVQFKVA